MEYAYAAQELSEQNLYMPNNPDSMSQVADWLLGGKLFLMFVVLPHLYHMQNFNKYKTSLTSLL
jgi:hypothetical protein